MTVRPQGTTHDVKIYDLVEVPSTVAGRPSKWRLRWLVGGIRPPFSQTLAKGAVEGRRSELITARAQGVAFDLETGLPVTELAARRAAEERQARDVMWYQHAADFARMMWPTVSPGHRRNLAESLATLTPAFYLPKARGRPDALLLRRVMYDWAYRPSARWQTERGEAVEIDPPERLAAAAVWLAANTIRVDQVDEAMVRAAVALGAKTLGGKPAAAKTAARHRSVLHSALDYAVERKLASGNLLRELPTVRLRVARALDPRSVANPSQVDALVLAVGTIDGGRYLRYRAFFGCVGKAGLRPEEARDLGESNIVLPDDEEDLTAWGWFLLDAADPELDGEWYDAGERESLPLKHRARGEVRRVPISPSLVVLIRAHIVEFGWRDGRLFRGERGGPLTTGMYGKVFRAARLAAFTPEQAASPLAETTYDLRHSALSNMLASGVDAMQVAKWAGHSLQMLYTVYAHVVDGREEINLARLAAAMEGGS